MLGLGWALRAVVGKDIDIDINIFIYATYQLGWCQGPGHNTQAVATMVNMAAV